MAILGTTKRPAVARVRTQKRAVEIVGLCHEHNIKAIVGIEPDKAEDIGDVEMALSRLKEGVADARIGRRKPFSSGSDKYSKAPVPSRRVDFSTLPPEVQMQFSDPQCAAFADAEFTVDFADIRNTIVGAGGSRNMAEDAEVGHVELGPHELRETDILLHLSAARDSQVARRGARARYSFSVTVTGQPPIYIERDDTVRLFFVAAFREGDAPNNPAFPWHPIVLANCASGQYVIFGTVPHFTPPPLITVLKVAIGLMLVTGLGLAVYAPHRQHRFSFVVSALGCIALAYLLKRMLKQAEEWSKRQLKRIAQLARDYPVIRGRRRSLPDSPTH
jgi:hypothetical protein